MPPGTIEGIEQIAVEGRDYRIAVPEGFLSERDKQLAAEIGLIPGTYADGTVVQRDGNDY